MNSYSTSWWSLLLINRPREDERLSWPCWLTYSGCLTHKVIIRPTSRRRTRKVRRSKTSVLPLCYAASCWMRDCSDVFVLIAVCVCVCVCTSVLCLCCLQIYKSTKCNDMMQTSYCPRGPFCAFAHVERMSIAYFTHTRACATRHRCRQTWVSQLLPLQTSSFTLFYHVLLRQEKGQWWRKRSRGKVHSMRGNWCWDFEAKCRQQC